MSINLYSENHSKAKLCFTSITIIIDLKGLFSFHLKRKKKLISLLSLATTKGKFTLTINRFQLNVHLKSIFIFFFQLGIWLCFHNKFNDIRSKDNISYDNPSSTKDVSLRIYLSYTISTGASPMCNSFCPRKNKKK